MPFVRISLPQSWPQEKIQAVSEGVYQAMISTINVPEGDRFQVITQHPHSLIVADKTYLGVQRSEEVVIIDITLARGRTEEQKKSLYRQIAENLNAGAEIRKEDMMIILTENGPADWSFGNGEAQMLMAGIKKHWAASDDEKK